MSALNYCGDTFEPRWRSDPLVCRLPLGHDGPHQDDMLNAWAKRQPPRKVAILPPEGPPPRKWRERQVNFNAPSYQESRMGRLQAVHDKPVCVLCGLLILRGEVYRRGPRGSPKWHVACSDALK